MFPSLYAILDPSLIKSPLPECAMELVEAGVRLIQIRHKRTSARQLYMESEQLLNCIRSSGTGNLRHVSRPNVRNSREPGSWEPPTSVEEHGLSRFKRAQETGRPEHGRARVEGFSPGGLASEVRLIINDRPDIAAILNAGGVHVGQEDLPVEAARAICPSPMWVGVSTHNVEQLRAAARTSADYIAVGPIFPTTTKENPDPIVGIDFLRLARQETGKPLVAIGGITIESAAEVFRAGADCVAVIRDLFGASSPAQRARQYLEIAATVRRST